MKLLLSLPVADMFAMFMAAHIYLYLHATLTADMAVDVTRLARDPTYRASTEADIAARAGLAVSFADVREERQARPQDFALEAIDWDEIRQLAKDAAEQLAGPGGVEPLYRQAGEWIDAALAEMDSLRRAEAAWQAREMPEKQPIRMEWGKDYLGVACASCGWEFAIIGPLDPVQMPPDKPFVLGARGPLVGDCPYCGHKGSYPVEEIHRVRRVIPG